MAKQLTPDGLVRISSLPTYSTLIRYLVEARGRGVRLLLRTQAQVDYWRWLSYDGEVKYPQPETPRNSLALHVLMLLYRAGHIEMPELGGSTLSFVAPKATASAKTALFELRNTATPQEIREFRCDLPTNRATLRERTALPAVGYQDGSYIPAKTVQDEVNEEVEDETPKKHQAKPARFTADGNPDGGTAWLRTYACLPFTDLDGLKRLLDGVPSWRLRLIGPQYSLMLERLRSEVTSSFETLTHVDLLDALAEALRQPHMDCSFTDSANGPAHGGWLEVVNKQYANTCDHFRELRAVRYEAEEQIRAILNGFIARVEKVVDDGERHAKGHVINLDLDVSVTQLPEQRQSVGIRDVRLEAIVTTEVTEIKVDKI